MYNAYNVAKNEKVTESAATSYCYFCEDLKYPYLFLRRKMKIIVVKIAKISAISIEYQMPSNPKKIGRTITPSA